MDYVAIFSEYGAPIAVIALAASVLGGAISAALTSWITYRRERQMDNRKKAMEVYDECLDALTRFRRNPSLALDDDYYIGLMGLSTKVYAYGGKDVSDAMRTFLESLKAHLQQYEDETSEIQELYWLPEHVDVDSKTGEEEVVSGAPRIDPNQYEAQLQGARNASIPTYAKAKEYVDPVVEAIRTAICPKFSKKGF